MDLTGLARRQWARHRADGFAAFSGAEVRVRLPVTETVLNDLLAPLRGSDTLRDPRVSLGAANRFRLSFTLSQWGFAKRIDLDFDVARTVDFPHDPRLRLTLATGGLIGFAVKALGKTIVQLLPGSATFAGGVLSIDLKAVLEQGGAGDLAPLVKVININVQPGSATFDTTLRVD